MNTSNDPLISINNKASKLKLNDTQHHIFICSGPKQNGCCSADEADTSWRYLKDRLTTLMAESKAPVVQRTKAECLRLCEQGPIMVIYPDGVWYRSCTVEVIERIIQEHILGGRVVEEYLISSHSPS